MKDLFQCKECGFLSTYYPGFIKVKDKLLCKYCATEYHGAHTKGIKETMRFIEGVKALDDTAEDILKKHFP